MEIKWRWEWGIADWRKWGIRDKQWTTYATGNRYNNGYEMKHIQDSKALAEGFWSSPPVRGGGAFILIWFNFHLFYSHYIYLYLASRAARAQTLENKSDKLIKTWNMRIRTWNNNKNNDEKRIQWRWKRNENKITKGIK